MLLNSLVIFFEFTASSINTLNLTYTFAKFNPFVKVCSVLSVTKSFTGILFKYFAFKFPLIINFSKLFIPVNFED